MLPVWRAQLDCGFAEVEAVLPDCLQDARSALSDAGLDAFLALGHNLGKLGRGPEPLLIFLETWPQVAVTVGEDALPAVASTVQAIHKSPNGRAIAPFLQSLPAVARRLPALHQLQRYLSLVAHLLQQTSGSIHGIHKTYASPGLPWFLETAPQVLQLLSIEGMRAWAEYGIRNTNHHPDEQRDYFALRSADSRAVLQRERHGTLLVDHTRPLDLVLRALWKDTAHLVPYSAALPADPATHAPRQPYCDEQGMRLPDVYEDRAGVRALDRYHAALAHMAAHRRWSTPIYADNYSPAQRLAIECFEDARIEWLAMRQYPGLRRIFQALHPRPVEGACDPTTHSCLRHRISILSRALLCPEVLPQNETVRQFVQQFHATMNDPAVGGAPDTASMAAMALRYLAKTRQQSDQLPTTWFTDTEVDYRDDNRHLWKFHELSDDEESFDSRPKAGDAQELPGLPPRHYPEWDYRSQSLRPDWVTLFEGLHPSGDAAHIEQLLVKHSALARQLQRMLDLLKPHARTRLRYQEDGAELDLDIALRAMIDFKAGSQPDPRITQSHRTDERSFAVTLLLDLSASLNEKVAETQHTILELSQEAVALLAWAVEQLGDPFAIAGFHSNTRHDVRYFHIKGFGERWGSDVKARLAAMQAGYSTRMGAAMRHAAHTLAHQKADKRLLLVLTDGQPSDVDVQDAQLLIADARHAVRELTGQGITSYCINLDPQADRYVREIFGNQFSVVDNIARLPERLPKLFMALTR